MALSNDLTAAERRALNNRKTTNEFVCDYPGCSRTAIEVLGFIRDINGRCAVCTEHLTSPGGNNKN